MLGAMAYAPTRAEGRRREFEAWCAREGYGRAAETLGQDWERMVTFYRYPKEHWVHLPTTNVVESPLAMLRLRRDAAELQAGRSDHCCDLEDAYDLREAVPASERYRPAGQGV
jgi:hypothetical protein